MDDLLAPGRLQLPDYMDDDLAPDFYVKPSKKRQQPPATAQSLNAFPDYIDIDKQTQTQIVQSKLLKRIVDVVSDGLTTLILHGELLQPRGQKPNASSECVIKIRRTPDNQYQSRVRVKEAAKREADNLRRMKKAKLRVPEVYVQTGDLLLMSFLRNKESAMSRLSELPAGSDTEKEADIYQQTLDMLKKSFNAAGLVHTEIRESNILLDEAGRCWFVDVGTAVDKGDACSVDFLFDLCGQVVEMFTKRGVAEVHTREDLFHHITGMSSSNRHLW